MSKKLYLCTNNFYTLFGTVSGEGNSEDVVAQRRRAAKKRKIPPVAGSENKKASRILLAFLLG